MFLEPFSAKMLCPLCKRMEYHLIEHQDTNFLKRTVFFLATCSNCQRVANLHNETIYPFAYRCSYKYWSEMEPLEDLPSLN